MQNIPDDQANKLTEFKKLAASMSANVNGAIMAFQFYDRLCQRLEHVQNNLHMLSELITDEGHISHAQGWESLRDKIKTSYTMETEHKMYEAVMRGASIEEALQIFKDEMAAKDSDEDDIELF
jgi:hypothetical protein